MGAIVGVGCATEHPMTTTAAANPMMIAKVYGSCRQAYWSQVRIHARLPPPCDRCVNCGEESRGLGKGHDHDGRLAVSTT